MYIGFTKLKRNPKSIQSRKKSKNSIMKNLRKLSKRELKTVQGGIPMCLPGYFWCSFVKKCIPVGSSCGLID
ncbi:hypothetical protein C1631_005480 [Chryseobacterium phosphatilyticum]|uniref:Bacteriocin n=1 Tax=Chryseobacterium phosphatilyticum TaxID=475075 RepID=A0A316XIP8_9FLAO|nr:hypothetical protein C1631_005480 [Chryseobacterium phosphatilyticum]